MSAHSLLAALARRHWKGLSLGLTALIIVDLMQLYVPRVIKFAVDDMTLGRATAHTLLAQAGLVAGLAVAMALLRMLWRPLLFGFARRAERDLRQRLFDHLQALHMGYFDANPPGELMARATDDLNNVRMATGMGLVAAMDGLMMGATAVGFMLFISPALTGLALLPMPLIAVLTQVQSRRFYRRSMAVQEAFSAMTEQVREVLAAMGMIKGYGLAGREAGRLDASSRQYLRRNMRMARAWMLMFPLMVFFTNLSLAIVLGAGGPMAVLGRISAGDFVAFTAYLGMLTWPMMALGWVVSLFQRGRASMGRISQVLTTPPAITDPAEPDVLDPDAGLGLEVRGLTFTHPTAQRPALVDLSLRAPAGQVTAIVGSIGSGKTTLLNLLARLYDPPPDTVLVEGRDVRRLRLADLRGHIVQVPQEAYLFSATVRENLALGRPEAGEAQLWAALEAADLAAEVRALPHGLDTELGERGQTLSGGQRQRLCLARALLTEPRVLALDDPLSAVDTRTEQRILANLARLRAGRTTLVVSHRLKSVTFASQIYVLDAGQVVESGSHEELVAAQGLYHNLFAEQALMAELEG